MSDAMITVSKSQLADTIGEVVEEKTAQMRQEMGKVSKAVFSRDDDEVTDAQKKVGRFFKALLKGDLVEAKSLSEGTPADGGYLVHSAFEAGVVRAMEQYGIARKYCTQYNVTSKDLEVTTLASNITTYWVAEGCADYSVIPYIRTKNNHAAKTRSTHPCNKRVARGRRYECF